MKNVSILFFFFTILGCDIERQKQEKANKAFGLKIEQELNSGIRNDTIFLGYWFGMTENQFISWTKKLIKEKKLYQNDRRQVAYKMTLDDNNFLATAQAVFSPEYFDGRLYKLNISIDPIDHSVPELTQLQLVRVYKNRYGFCDHIKNSIFDDSNDYIWIDGNRQIEITKGISDARIFYTDLAAERALNERKEVERSEELKETISNI